MEWFTNVSKASRSRKTKDVEIELVDSLFGVQHYGDITRGYVYRAIQKSEVSNRIHLHLPPPI